MAEPLPNIPLPELAKRAAGGRPDMSRHLARRDVTRQLPGVSPKWYQMSQNISAVVYSAAGNWKWLAALARLWEREGLFGSELGSPGQYFSSVAYALAVSLRDCRAAKNEEEEDILRRALRAVWTWDALAALPVPRSRVEAVLGGVGRQKWPGARGYQGLTCAVSGNRWNGNPREMRWHKGIEEHGELLSVALDWQPRRRQKQVAPEDIFHTLSGTRKWADSIAPEIFGLLESERQVLREVVSGSVDAARRATLWLVPFGVRRHWAGRLTRTDSGVESIFLGPYPNPNKPAHACTQLLTNGTWRTLRPAFSRNTNVARGYAVELRDGQIIARVERRCGEEVSMPALQGEGLWEVDVRGDQITFNGEPVEMDRPRRPYPA
jgi:hypothetical protein